MKYNLCVFTSVTPYAELCLDKEKLMIMHGLNTCD